MEDVETVATKVPLRLTRVDSVETVQALMPYLSHNEELLAYATRMFRDPDTLILWDGHRGCAITSLMEHPFVGRIAVLAWAQNPDHHGLSELRQVMWTIGQWAKERGATKLCSFVGADGPWQNPRAYSRLTGLQPHRIVFAKEL